MSDSRSEYLPGPTLWRALAIILPVIGVGCVTLLIWGLSARLDRWDIREYVLLIYTVAACTVGSSLVAWRLVKMGTREVVPLGALRWLLWAVVVITFFWVWFPPVERFVGWWIRQVTMFRFG